MRAPPAWSRADLSSVEWRREARLAGVVAPLALALSCSSASNASLAPSRRHSCSHADVKGNGVDVKGNGVDVKGNRGDVKGKRADVTSIGVDVKGNGADVKGESGD
eukprot:1127133-Prorocentrum_minimum.AAC.2